MANQLQELAKSAFAHANDQSRLADSVEAFKRGIIQYSLMPAAYGSSKEMSDLGDMEKKMLSDMAEEYLHKGRTDLFSFQVSELAHFTRNEHAAQNILHSLDEHAWHWDTLKAKHTELEEAAKSYKAATRQIADMLKLPVGHIEINPASEHLIINPRDAAKAVAIPFEHLERGTIYKYNNKLGDSLFKEVNASVGGKSGFLGAIQDSFHNPKTANKKVNIAGDAAKSEKPAGILNRFFKKKPQSEAIAKEATSGAKVPEKKRWFGKSKTKPGSTAKVDAGDVAEHATSAPIIEELSEHTPPDHSHSAPDEHTVILGDERPTHPDASSSDLRLTADDSSINFEEERSNHTGESSPHNKLHSDYSSIKQDEVKTTHTDASSTELNLHPAERPALPNDSGVDLSKPTDSGIDLTASEQATKTNAAAIESTSANSIKTHATKAVEIPQSLEAASLQAEKEWEQAFSEFSMKVDGRKLVKQADGGLRPEPFEGGVRHSDLEAFHNDLKARTNDAKLTEPKSPFWDAQSTIEGTFAHGEGGPKQEIIDELLTQYQKHIPEETKKLLLASEKRFSAREKMLQNELEILNSCPSYNEIPKDHPLKSLVRSEDDLINHIANSESELKAVRSQLGHVKNNISKFIPEAERVVEQVAKEAGAVTAKEAKSGFFGRIGGGVSSGYSYVTGGIKSGVSNVREGIGNVFSGGSGGGGNAAAAAPKAETFVQKVSGSFEHAGLAKKTIKATGGVAGAVMMVDGAANAITSDEHKTWVDRVARGAEAAAGAGIAYVSLTHGKVR